MRSQAGDHDFVVNARLLGEHPIDLDADSRNWSGTDSPSGAVPERPAASWSLRPATLTWKNSSRLLENMARNFACSNNGCSGASARARTATVELEPGKLPVDVAAFVGGHSHRQRAHLGHAPRHGCPRPVVLKRVCTRSGRHTAHATARSCSKQLIRPSALGRGDKVVVVFGHAQVPLEQHVFSLGVAYDPLPVAPELRVVGG